MHGIGAGELELHKGVPEISDPVDALSSLRERQLRANGLQVVESLFERCALFYFLSGLAHHGQSRVVCAGLLDVLLEGLCTLHQAVIEIDNVLDSVLYRRTDHEGGRGGHELLDRAAYFLEAAFKLFQVDGASFRVLHPRGFVCLFEVFGCGFRFFPRILGVFRQVFGALGALLHGVPGFLCCIAQLLCGIRRLLLGVAHFSGCPSVFIHCPSAAVYRFGYGLLLYGHFRCSLRRLLLVSRQLGGSLGRMVQAVRAVVHIRRAFGEIGKESLESLSGLLKNLKQAMNKLVYALNGIVGLLCAAFVHVEAYANQKVLDRFSSHSQIHPLYCMFCMVSCHRRARRSFSARTASISWASNRSSSV